MKWIGSLLNVTLISLFCFVASCKDDTGTPRPIAYPRISLPEKAYQKFDRSDCPFSFDYPVYCDMIQDSFFFDQSVSHLCWMDMDFPGIGARIHLSYKPMKEGDQLGKLIEDAYKMAFKHTLKASYIDEQVLHVSPEVGGIIYHVGGNSASNAQFFITDSVKHFIRGALYFQSAPNEDSLAPAIKFVKEDMVHMIETFSWRD